MLCGTGGSQKQVPWRLPGYVLDNRVKSRAVNRSPPGGELDQWPGRKPDGPDRTERVVRVCWERLAEEPVKNGLQLPPPEELQPHPGGSEVAGASRGGGHQR